jgi:hypothetical protein
MNFGPFPPKPLHSDPVPPSLRKQCCGCIAWYITLCPVYRSPSFANFFPAIRQFNITMARTNGSVHYKNDVLIDIINKLLPSSEVAWEAICTAYFTQLKEKALHNTTDVRKHWTKNLCNNMRKPTGRTGKNGNCIHQCMLIQKKIMKKTHSGMIGLSSDSDSLLCDNGDENMGGGGQMKEQGETMFWVH